MFNFDFYNPTHIVFGKNRIPELDTLIPPDAVVLITYGGGSAEKSGLLGKIRTALGGRTFFEFGGIEPNPRYETLMKAVAVAKTQKVDFLLAVGGGSVIDGTKFIALASCYGGEGADILKFGLMPVPAEVVGKALPIGTVLTLPATGSEMNSGAVISLGHSKLPLMSGMVFPKFSLLDPTLTYTLPKNQVANGIVDAFVHTIEQYLTFPAEGRVQDRFCEGLLQTLIEIGGASVDDAENYDVRANHMWAATMALNGLIAAGMPQDWATHMIGHELTARFGIDHGRTLAIVLPSLLAVRKEKKMAKLVQYAERVWNITSGGDDEKANAAIAKTREFFEGLGIDTKLSSYGVNKEEIDEVIAALEAHGMTALSESRDLTPKISRTILENAM